MLSMIKRWRKFINENEKKDTNTVVKAVIHNDENKILALISHGYDKWDLPGGHVQEEEKLLDALKREIKEEIGLSIDSAEKLSYINENTIHFYKARLPNQEINLSDEHSDYRLITAEDINKLSKKFQPAIKEVLEQWQTSEQ